jgi:hypothetical protein
VDGAAAAGKAAVKEPLGPCMSDARQNRLPSSLLAGFDVPQRFIPLFATAITAKPLSLLAGMGQ